MKILGCHISGFGCYQDASFTFEDGLNTVLRENGTGKSTLQAFLRVMLYGFKNETKKTKEREREIRRPWRGTAYGGTLDVEASGKTYRIERAFGSKASEDRLLVFDLVTRNLTGELTETPGKALFGVDSDTFERTAFVSEETIQTYVTDGVHAKLGNLSEDPADVNRYEGAMKLLADFLNRNSEARSTGALYQLNDTVARAEQETASIGSVEKTLAENERVLSEIRKEEEKLGKEADELAEKQKKLSAYQSLSAERAAYEGLKKAAEERDKEANAARSAMSGEVPSGAELKTADDWLQEAGTAGKLAENERLSEADEQLFAAYEEEFRNGEADPEEADQLLDIAGRLQQSRVELRAKRNEREREKETGEAEAAAVRKTAVRSFFFAAPSLAAFIILLAVTLSGVLPGAAVWPYVLMGALLLLAAGLIAFGAVSLKKSKQKADRTVSAYMEGGEALQKSEADLQQAEEKLRSYLASFGRVSPADGAGKEIMEILKDQNVYQKLQEKKKRFENFEKMRTDAERSLDAFLTRFSAQEDGNRDRETRLRELSEKVLRLKTSGEEVLRAKQALQRFEFEHDVAAMQSIERPEGTETLEELAEMQQENRKRSEELRTLSGKYEQENERLKERLSDLEDEAGRLVGLRAERTNLREKVRIMEKTKTLLTEAKRSLSEKYADPVQKSFEEYAKTILDGTGLKFDLDADGHAVIEDRGLIRSADLFSSGYQTLTYFCLRLALVDAMYKNERPVLFLDDPFAELDEPKLKKAKELLSAAAERYQILYFTCHPSRA